MYSNILLFFKKYIIPRPIFDFFQPAYHYILALSAAIFYRFPARKIKVIAVTGTKGKSSTVEIISAILEEAGYSTALSNTIRTKIGKTSTENKFKMSMPGRFFVQRFISRAVNAKCDVAIMEMTSQGSLQYRHRFIDLDTFVLTNISPEHIEAHGSFEKYVSAKVAIAKAMQTSKKRPRTIITNADDKESARFIASTGEKIEYQLSYGLADAGAYTIGANGIDFTLPSENGQTSTQKIHSPLSGLFNLYNILAAIAAVRTLPNITDEVIVRAIEKFSGIRGRVEYIKISENQPFDIVVDYAHTADSLEKFYSIFKTSEKNWQKICVLGGTGGGRDAWKRLEMGRIAATNCDHVILTNEDPYDEDPMAIIEDVKKGAPNAIVILDRREAIRHAITLAKTYAHTKIAGTAEQKKNVILITGKGTDPYIMGPNGSKIPWDDAQVAREEIANVLRS